MKLALLSLALCAVLSGCSENDLQRKAVMNSVGNFRSISGSWIIKISDKEPYLSVTRDFAPKEVGVMRSPLEGIGSVSPGDWNISEGFIVVQGPGDRIFSFDGKDRIWILERHDDGTRSWDKNFPGKFPDEFIRHLPEALQSQLAEQAGGG